MNKVLEFIMSYVICLLAGFLGVWVGSLVMGTDTNPFTDWVPYVLALIIPLSSLLFKD